MKYIAIILFFIIFSVVRAKLPGCPHCKDCYLCRHNCKELESSNNKMDIGIEPTFYFKTGILGWKKECPPCSACKRCEKKCRDLMERHGYTLPPEPKVTTTSPEIAEPTNRITLTDEGVTNQVTTESGVKTTNKGKTRSGEGATAKSITSSEAGATNQGTTGLKEGVTFQTTTKPGRKGTVQTTTKAGKRGTDHGTTRSSGVTTKQATKEINQVTTEPSRGVTNHGTTGWGGRTTNQGKSGVGSATTVPGIGEGGENKQCTRGTNNNKSTDLEILRLLNQLTRLLQEYLNAKNKS